jgi:hypothetical protein
MNDIQDNRQRRLTYTNYTILRNEIQSTLKYVKDIQDNGPRRSTYTYNI